MALETAYAYMAVVREEKTEKRKGVIHDASLTANERETQKKRLRIPSETFSEMVSSIISLSLPGSEPTRTARPESA